MIGDIIGDFVIVGFMVYVVNYLGCIVVFDLESGECKWIVEEGVIGLVWFVGSDLFFVNE